MIAQQLLRLVQELAFVLRTRSFITSPQLRQKCYPCPFTHRFIHSGQGNPTFGATYSFTALLTPSRVTILLAQFAPHKISLTVISGGLRLMYNSLFFRYRRQRPHRWRSRLHSLALVVKKKS